MKTSILRALLLIAMIIFTISPIVIGATCSIVLHERLYALIALFYPSTYCISFIVLDAYGFE